MLSRYIAGIGADEVAWKKYHVLPNLAYMTAVKQVVPSVKGYITVDIKLSDKAYAMELNSPEGTTAMVGIPKKGFKAHVVHANGQPVWKGKFVSGVSGVSWHGENENYILFNVKPGEWMFSAQ